jgi:diadenosine tetraphosphate (Ap4A) HIT family hydrolase
MAQSTPTVGSPEFGGCIFCHLNREIIAEGRLSLGVFDGFPVSTGHALVIPRRHVATIWDMTDEEYAERFCWCGR